MDRRPLVSVIIPCYNCEKYVLIAVESILQQSYSNMEIIIVDDCSTDGTYSILKQIAQKDDRIKLLKHDINRKLIYTLNEMIDIASGEFIARMDADDIAANNRIEEQLEYMINDKECAVCGTSMEVIDSSGNTMFRRMLPTDCYEIKKMMPMVNVICHPSIMVRSDVYKSHKYDEKYLHAEDYELWCRLLYKHNYKIVNLRMIGIRYRENENQISQRYAVEQNSIVNNIVRTYQLVDEKWQSVHEAIFHEGKTNVTGKEIEQYLNFVYCKLKRIDARYTFGVVRKILLYLKKNNMKLFLRYLFTQKGLYTIGHILKIKTIRILLK